MKFSSRNILCAIFIFFAIGPSSLFAVNETDFPNQVLADLSEIKSRLQAIENQQKEILAREDKILAEQDRLRVWVHRK